MHDPEKYSCSIGWHIFLSSTNSNRKKNYTHNWNEYDLAYLNKSRNKYIVKVQWLSHAEARSWWKGNAIFNTPSKDVQLLLHEMEQMLRVT